MRIETVLVADDDRALRDTLKLALEAAGYRVRLAADGGEAFALQQTAPSDVLVTDIFMPDADGFEAIDRFRTGYPQTPIIAMSGGPRRGRRDYLSAASLIGVEATLKKPFRIDALLGALRSLEG